MPELNWPKPAWRGVMVGVDEAFGQHLFQTLNRGRQGQIDRAEANVSLLKRDLDAYTDTIRRLSANYAEAQAQLARLKEEAENSFTPEEIQQQLEFIQGLPGVLGMRVENGYPVVHVRTSIVYGGRVYDMGDFEVTPRISKRYHEQETIPVYCTRTGTQPRDYQSTGRHYGDHFYFEGSFRQDGTGSGWFCFGVRSVQIKQLLVRGNIAEALHLIIATMNSVNDEHLPYIPKHYTALPLSGFEALKAELRARRLLPRRRLPLP